MNILNFLSTFEAICKTGSLSRAAQELGVSQPSISRQLKLLEEHVGGPLFARQRHGVAISPLGERLRTSVGSQLESIKGELAEIRSQQGSLSGTVTIGSLTEIGKSFLVPKVLEFMQDYPEVRIEIHLQKGFEIISSVVAGDCDFGIVAEMPEHDGMIVQQLFSERSVMVTGIKNSRDLRSVADYYDATFVAYRKDDPLLMAYLRKILGSFSRQRIQIAFAVNDHQAMTAALNRLDSYAVMPLESVQSAISSGQLRLASSHEFVSKVWLVKRVTAREKSVFREFSRHLLSKN